MPEQQINTPDPSRFIREERIEEIAINHIRQLINKQNLNFIHNRVCDSVSTWDNARHGDLIIENINNNERINFDLKRAYTNVVFISNRFMRNYQHLYIIVYSLDQNENIVPNELFLFNKEYVEKYFNSCIESGKPFDKGYYSGDKGYKIPVSEFRSKFSINKIIEFL